MFLLWHPSLTAINLSYTFPILETSATALCGTTGIYVLCIHVETENKDFSDLIKLEKDGHEKSWIEDKK